METKNYKGTFREMKEDGTAVVVFATMNIVDKDGDITLPGAFGEQICKVQPAHNWDVPNIGIAKIKEVKDEAIADIQFFLDMPSAKEWYTAIKRNHDVGVTQEYSYGFHIEQEDRRDVENRSVRGLLKLKVHEVSPVLLGAGMGTRTLAIKSCQTCGNDATKASCTCKKQQPVKPEEKTMAMMMGSWESVMEKIRMAAHGMLFDEDEENGWVSIEGTYSNRVIVSAYNQDEYHCYQFDWARGEDGMVELTNQTEVELAVVAQEKGLRMGDNFLHVIGEVKSLIRRVGALAAQRQKEGRALSRANRDRLSSLMSAITTVSEALTNVGKDIGSLLAETDRAPEESTAEVINYDGGKELELLAQFQSIQTDLVKPITT